MQRPPHMFVCFEPHLQAYAQRLDSWPRTNPDLERYGLRVDIDVDSPQADAPKSELEDQIRQADVLVCLIALSTARDPWITWELSRARRAPGPIGLVGVLMQELNAHPREMVDCGAIFVPFRRDVVERALQWALTERHTTGDFTLRDF